MQQYVLVYNNEEDRLELRDFANKNSRPLHVDFLSPQLLHRRNTLAGGQELMAKAIGHKQGVVLKILDATAGFGVDAFMLASLGHDVTMLERSPIIAALLQDGLRRAFKAIADKDLMLKLINVDAIIYMRQLDADAKPDVVYLDPMYPERKKTALGKKTMRILKDIVGEDLDANVLFRVALQCAKKRVVVKRPRLAKALVDDVSSTFIMYGRSCRYDIYCAHNIHY